MAEPNTPSDDELDDLVQESLKRTVFAGPPTGVGVPAKPLAPPEKKRTLADLGINTKGGTIKESGAPVVHRTQLENPLTNPKSAAVTSAQRIVKSSILDASDPKELTPEFGISSLMTSMDANFEQRANDLAQAAVLPAARPEPPSASPSSAPTANTTLRELLQMAKARGGTLELAATHFTLEIQIR
jgi:hypothetical protein